MDHIPRITNRAQRIFPSEAFQKGKRRHLVLILENKGLHKRRGPTVEGKSDFWPHILLLSTLALVFRITLMQRQRTALDFAQVDTSAAIEVALVGVTVILLMMRSDLLLGLWEGLKATSGRWLGLFFFVAVASAAWSVNPAYSMFRAVEFAVESIAFVGVLAYAGPFVRSERLVIFSVLAVVLMNALSHIIPGRVNLMALRDNSLGACSVMLFCYGLGEALVRVGKQRRTLVIIAAAALLLVLCSRSLASWWCALLGVGLASVLAKSKQLLFPICIVVIALWVSGVGMQKLLPLTDPYGEIEKVDTMNGRKQLWEGYLETIKEKPWFGVGYAVGPRVAGPFYATNTHNSAIAVLLGTGMVGSAFVLLASFAALREALAVCIAMRPGAVGSVTAMLVGSINGMSISAFGDTWIPASFVLMLFYAFFLFMVLRPYWMARRFYLRRPPTRSGIAGS